MHDHQFYSGPVYQAIFNYVKSKLSGRYNSFVPDVVQNSLAKFHLAKQTKVIENDVSYATRIARNECANFYRARKRNMEDASELEDQEVKDDEEWDSLFRAEIKEDYRKLLEAIRTAVKSLPEKQREVIEMHYYQGFSQKEISQITGRSIQAIRGNKHHGIQNLKKQFL